MTFLLGAIGLVSLVVGGIGVMNIMLVAVSERAREIGVRMAVGGRRSDIQSQFLTEAVVVCLIGGAAGVLISVAPERSGQLFFTESMAAGVVSCGYSGRGCERLARRGNFWLCACAQRIEG